MRNAVGRLDNAMPCPHSGCDHLYSATNASQHTKYVAREKVRTNEGANTKKEKLKEKTKAAENEKNEQKKIVRS